MRLMTCLAILFLLPSTNAFAQDYTTEIISEPPEVAVKIITNAWTARFNDEIEKFKRQGYSPENIAKLQSGFEDIKRKNPSKIINCITPCKINIPFKTWQRSEISAIKQGFPNYSANLSTFSKVQAKTPPEQINLVLSTPNSVPKSCIFDDGYGFKDSQNEQPCYRPKSEAPKSLRRKKLSYKCEVEFDLDVTGKTENIQITNCPEKKLYNLTLKNVQYWRYVPKTEAGKAVTVKGLRSNISYIYSDKYGKKYPLYK